MSLAIKKRSWKAPSQEEWQKIWGIKICKSRFPRNCQLCWKHQFKYRRVCPICNNLIAPGCWPVKCWMDELNHCKDCHTLIEIMKNMRYKKQFMPNMGKSAVLFIYTRILNFNQGISRNIFQQKNLS